ncbi:aminopeptidase P family protein [Pontibacter burrus]|uniref:Xaa-Pro aminopeptidase n=1 Tax=Pontibacter burrus TaxID=2704466 RepID=A0A6B3LLP1_9BACT|nr:aminopeptidase P family protein [Pontibacter burrus]NEM97709.1 aminopeptidase P family protein [Pontibacter burrus]
MFDATTYTQRRQQLKQQLGGGLVLLLGNEEAGMNYKDNWYPFYQDSTFRYYFGLDLADLTGVIDIDRDEVILFGPEQSIDDVVWTGPLPSLASLAEQVGVHNVMPNGKIADYLAGANNLHYLPPYRPEHQLKLQAWTGKTVLEPSLPLIETIVAQRSIKSEAEIQEIEKAVTFTSRMHRSVMQFAREGMKEHEVASEAIRYAEATGNLLSFPVICTTQGQILHNHYRGNTLKANDMLLLDAGIQTAAGYAGDMTRTFPVGPTFTERQRELYQVVLDTHEAAMAALKPGMLYKDVHLLACRKLTDGLKQVGLMHGDTDEAVQAGAHTMFFQCGLGHMMGMDVHDMENLGEQYVGYTPELRKSTEFGLKSLRLGRALEPGFVLTVEPGIYIIPELIDMRRNDKVAQQFINFEMLDTYRDFGGIRIEDDLVITESGSRILGEPLPKTITEVEAIRQQAL